MQPRNGNNLDGSGGIDDIDEEFEENDERPKKSQQRGNGVTVSDKFTGDAARVADAGIDDDNNPLSNWTDPPSKVPKSRMESEDLENTVKREKMGQEDSFLINNGNINGPILPKIETEQ